MSELAEQIAHLQDALALAINDRLPHARIRSLRMRIARLKGTHTKAEWENLKDEFGHRCVKCGARGRHLDKDHIVPVYQGGSDGLDNIQPLCAWCNAGKSQETTNWAAFRRERGFNE